jgi:hypothetical protein
MRGKRDTEEARVQCGEKFRASARTASRDDNGGDVFDLSGAAMSTTLSTF